MVVDPPGGKISQFTRNITGKCSTLNPLGSYSCRLNPTSRHAERSADSGGLWGRREGGGGRCHSITAPALRCLAASHKSLLTCLFAPALSFSFSQPNAAIAAPQSELPGQRPFPPPLPLTQNTHPLSPAALNTPPLCDF